MAVFATCFVVVVGIVAAVTAYMVGAYEFVTRRMNLDVSFAEFCRLYHRNR